MHRGQASVSAVADRHRRIFGVYRYIDQRDADPPIVIFANTMTSKDSNGNSNAAVARPTPTTSTEYQLALVNRWKRCLANAKTAWPHVAEEELFKVGVNFHKMAGLLQLRMQLTRQEADRQAKEFFDLHMA